MPTPVGQSPLSSSKPVSSATTQPVQAHRKPFSPAKVTPILPTGGLEPPEPPINGPVEARLADDYPDAVQLEVQDEPPQPDGRFVRNRLLKTGMKYPLVRLVETWIPHPEQGVWSSERTQESVADHLLVRIPGGRKAADLAATLTGSRVRGEVGAHDLYLLSWNQPSLDRYTSMLTRFRTAGLFQYVDEDYLVRLAVEPNDAQYEDQWGLHNEDDHDIDAPEAWDLETGSSSVIVGVIDTGIDHNHVDLAANMWVNSGEIPDNGVDDDNNGYIDDVYGYNFYEKNGNAVDTHFHGTHVAGTIGAIGNNGTGVTGVAWSVQLMALKFLGPNGGYISDAVEAVLYADMMGAHLTNNSWGGGGFSTALAQAIATAGNNGRSLWPLQGMRRPVSMSPISIQPPMMTPSIVTVAASNAADRLTGFSNYGSKVTVAAPWKHDFEYVSIGFVRQYLWHFYGSTPCYWRLGLTFKRRTIIERCGYSGAHCHSI